MSKDWVQLKSPLQCHSRVDDIFSIIRTKICVWTYEWKPLANRFIAFCFSSRLLHTPTDTQRITALYMVTLHRVHYVKFSIIIFTRMKIVVSFGILIMHQCIGWQFNAKSMQSSHSCWWYGNHKRQYPLKSNARGDALDVSNRYTIQPICPTWICVQRYELAIWFQLLGIQLEPYRHNFNVCVTHKYTYTQTWNATQEPHPHRLTVTPANLIWLIIIDTSYVYLPHKCQFGSGIFQPRTHTMP